MTWCEITFHDVTWRDLTWHDVTWRDMTWHDVTWREITWHDMTLRDMTIKLTMKRWSCDRPATFARLLINLELYCQGTNVWVTSKTSWTRRWPEFLRFPKHSSLLGFSRLPKHGSSVEISAMDSLTSKIRIVWKFQKFIRQNHQYRSNRKLTWLSRSLKHRSSVRMDSLTSKT